MKRSSPHTVVRAVNDRAFCSLLGTHGPMTRPQLARAAGISSPATLKVVERLQDAGLVAEVGYDPSRRPGPKAALFGLAPGLGLATAIELTHDRLQIQHRDLSQRETTEVFSLDFDEAHDVAGQLARAIDQTQPEGNHLNRWVSVSTIGPVDPRTGDLRFSTELPSWQPGLASQIRARLRCDVEFDNEVNFRAEVARPVHGDGEECDTFALLHLGSGVGGALVINGQVWTGSRGAAGELAWLQTPSEFGHSYQDLAGGWYLAEAFGHRHDLAFGWLQSLVDAATPSSTLYDDLAARILPGLVAVATVHDPHCLALTGPTATIGGNALGEALQRQLQKALNWEAPTVHISPIGPESVLLGGLTRATRNLSALIFPTPLT